MIVKMKRITVLVPEKAKQACLADLRKLGVLHIKNISEPESPETAGMEELISASRKAKEILSQYTSKCGDGDALSNDEFENIIRNIISADKERREIVKHLAETEEQLEYFKIWGAFDPSDIKMAAEKGIFIKLYRAHKKQEKKLAGLQHIHRIKEQDGFLYFAHISGDPGAALASFEEIALPKKSASLLKAEHEQAHKKLAEKEEAIKEKSFMSAGIDRHIALLYRKLSFLNAVNGMGKEKGFQYIQGFCPAEKAGGIMKMARSRSYGFLIEDTFEDAETPTLIKNPKWINIINPVFTFMNTVPGYKEYDVSLSFLVFFSLFFAMLVGDAGYGVLFMLVTFWASRKFRTVPREPFYLLFLLSGATIFWGAISGTWFGSEKISKLPIFHSLIIGKFYSFSAVSNEVFMMKLCFTIGAVHLTVAHLMIVIRIINSWKALADIGWVMIVWGLYFLVGMLILNEAFPAYAGYLLMAGTALILIFANFQKNVLKGMLTTVIDLPLKIISAFSDIVSYIRLFAVGYASCVVSVSFNDMAMAGGFNNVIASLGAAVILFLGHSLNIILGFMAVIVHGLRLNMLEFSGHLGMEWSGKEYKPFSE